MSKLSYLMDEISAGMEVYYSGKNGGQYLKTAYILCDDYVELVTKLYLVEKIAGWTDKKTNGSFKNFHDILKDLEKSLKGHRAPDVLMRVQAIQQNMSDRRKRRNDFFHSTHLLDLNVTQRVCVEAFCELMEYGGILFLQDWNAGVQSRCRMETLVTLFQLELRSFSDATVWPKINSVLKDWPRRSPDKKTISKKGTQYAEHPEDLHLRLCLDWGGQVLRDKLKSMLIANP